MSHEVVVAAVLVLVVVTRVMGRPTRWIEEARGVEIHFEQSDEVI